MIQFFKPLKGCRMVASKDHPTMKELEYIGTVEKVDGDQVVFRNRTGELERIIWRFKDGNNKFVYFGA